MVAQKDPLGDGEPEAGSVGSSREEGVEDAVLDRVGYACARVGDVDRGRCDALRPLPEAERDHAALGHGLHGVDQQVEQHLLDLALVALDHQRLAGRLERQVDLVLGHLESDQQERVVDDLRQVAARVQVRGGLGEAEDPGDDALQLVELLADHPHVGLPRIALLEVQAEPPVQQLEHGQRVADLVGNLRGEEPQGRQALAFSQGFLALEDTRVKPDVLEGYRAEPRQGEAKPLLVIVEAVDLAREDGEDPQNLALIDDRGGEQGLQALLVGEIRHLAKPRGLDVEVGDRPAGMDGRGHQAGIQRNVPGGNLRHRVAHVGADADGLGG